MSNNDIWTTDATVLGLFLISTAGQTQRECSAGDYLEASLVILHTATPTPVPKEDTIQHVPHQVLGDTLIKVALTPRN